MGQDAKRLLTYFYSMGQYLIHYQRLVQLACIMWITSYAQDLSGQVDSVITLNTIEVTAQRIDFTDIGKHSEHLDTNRIGSLRSATLASMLADQTPLYVRTYGNGTLATLGIRGGNASHTQIIWNGIPIRNPMIGLVDLHCFLPVLSTMPLFTMEVTVRRSVQER